MNFTCGRVFNGTVVCCVILAINYHVGQSQMNSAPNELSSKCISTNNNENLNEKKKKTIQVTLTNNCTHFESNQKKEKKITIEKNGIK